ncbi:MAG: SIS domain-containing protein [Ktedonobacteraceae bacterium]
MSNAEGSDFDRMFYPFLFEREKVHPDEVLAQVRHSTMEKCHEVVALRRTMLKESGQQIIATGKAMANAFTSGGTLLAFGNGGSTTDVQDMVTQLLHPHDSAWPPLPAIALTNDIAVITAVGNDVGFDNIFSRQIIAFGRPGDIAFGISTSGNSSNIVAAFEQAKRQGLLTVALAGYDGGKLARSRAVDYCIVTPSDHIPRIQEAQATTYHALLEILATLLQEERT